MKFRRIITSLLLWFAFWAPLQNALAAAVVQGCPMMTPAFSQGWQTLWGEVPQHSACPMHDSMASVSSSVDSVLPHLMTYQCADDRCSHCSWCLLLGTPALPTVFPAVPAALSPVAYRIPSSILPRVAPVSALFRPPIL
ncbi:hypothetical protein [Halothiobacillus sp. DCM-1]|uniref:hypothetical protein n=1 Tax=Halothiobacillus sp. DCM-1 TaxID=3112558 RepID=UPI00324787A7